MSAALSDANESIHIRTVSASKECYGKQPDIQILPSRLPTTDGDRAVYSLRALADMQIHCMIRLNTWLDEDRMARAIRLTIQEFPILGMKLKMGWLNPYWVRRSDINEKSVCTLLEVNDTEQAQASLKEWMSLDLRPEHDPLLQVRIFRVTQVKPHDLICIKVTHVVADAGAVKEIAYKITQFYRDLDVSPSCTAHPNLHGSRSFQQILKRFTWKQRWHFFRRTRRNLKSMFNPMERSTIVLSEQKSSAPTYAFYHLSTEQNQSLQKLGRQHQATLNDVIIAILARGTHRFTGAKDTLPLRLLNTVDLRRYLPNRQAENICNLSGFSYPNIGIQQGKTLGESIQDARTEMNDLKSEHLGLSDINQATWMMHGLPVRFHPWIMPFARSFLKKVSCINFTNMGNIDDALLDFGDAFVEHAWLTASIIYPPLFIGGVSGFRKQITISTGFCQNAFSKEKAEKLLETIADELPLDTN